MSERDDELLEALVEAYGFAKEHGAKPISYGVIYDFPRVHLCADDFDRIFSGHLVEKHWSEGAWYFEVKIGLVEWVCNRRGDPPPNEQVRLPIIQVAGRVDGTGRVTFFPGAVEEVGHDY
jgi:hypothetical protein